jgi:hypothetical protein
LTPAEYTSLDWTYPDARPCQCIFYYPFGCSFPSVRADASKAYSERGALL